MKQVLVIGVAYLVLHFIPGVPVPRNMQLSAFEESMGYSTSSTEGPAQQQESPYPQKTFVSEEPTV